MRLIDNEINFTGVQINSFTIMKVEQKPQHENLKDHEDEGQDNARHKRRGNQSRLSEGIAK